MKPTLMRLEGCASALAERATKVRAGAAGVEEELARRLVHQRRPLLVVDSLRRGLDVRTHLLHHLARRKPRLAHLLDQLAREQAVGHGVVVAQPVQRLLALAGGHDDHRALGRLDAAQRRTRRQRPTGAGLAEGVVAAGVDDQQRETRAPVEVVHHLFQREAITLDRTFAADLDVHRQQERARLRRLRTVAGEEEHDLVALLDAAEESVELAVEHVACGVEHARDAKARGFELPRDALCVVARIAQLGHRRVVVVAHHQRQARRAGLQRGAGQHQRERPALQLRSAAPDPGHPSWARIACPAGPAPRRPGRRDRLRARRSGGRWQTARPSSSGTAGGN